MLDFCVALRRVRQHPWSVAALIFLIGTSVGVNTAVFSDVNDVLLADFPYPHPEQLVRLWSGDKGQGTGQLRPSEYHAASEQGRATFVAVAAYRPSELRSSQWGTVSGAYVTPTLFDVLGVQPTCASSTIIDEAVRSGTAVVLLRDGFAQLKGLSDKCGQRGFIDLDGKSVAIVGFLPDALMLPDQPADVFVPFDPQEEHVRSGAAVMIAMRPVFSIARLRSRGQLADIVSQVRLPGGLPLHMMPLRQQEVERVADSIVLLQILAAFVFVVTLINATQLFGARVSEHLADGRIRAALGASRSQAQKPIAIETFLVALLGGGVGVWVHVVASRVLASFGPPATISGFTLKSQWPVLLLGLGATLFTGIVPVLPVLLRAPDRGGLAGWLGGTRERVGSRPSELHFGRFLLLAQAAVTTAAVVVGALLVASMMNLLSVDLGFNASGVRTADISLQGSNVQQRVSAIQALLRTVADHGTSAAVASTVPFGAHTWISVDVSRGIEGVTAERVIASQQFFHVLGIRIREGRGFSETDDASGEGVVVVSSSFSSRFMKGLSLGRGLFIAGQLWTIVGVADDVHARGVRLPSVPTVYVNLPQASRIAAADASTALAKAQLIELSPGLGSGEEAPIGQFVPPTVAGLSVGTFKSLHAAVDLNTRPTRFLTGVVIVFASITLILGALAMAVAARQSLLVRRVELAVRIALGATPRNARALLLSACVFPALVGIVFGLPLGYVSAALVRAHLFGLGPNFALPYVVGAVTVSVASVGAVAGSVYRAGLVNPSEALRSL